MFTVTGEVAKIKLDLYSKVFPYLAYDAVSIGEREAQMISESGKSKLFGDAIPTVCANLLNTSTGKLVASEPYIVKKTPAGLKVGVIGLLSDQAADRKALDKWGMKVLSPKEALDQYIGELRGKSDVIVLLLHMDFTAAKPFVSELRDIDVVLVGHLSAEEQKGPERVGNTLLMQTRSAGKYMCKLVLNIGADREIASYSGGYIGLDKSFQDDPEISKWLEEQNSAILRYYMEKRTREQQSQPDKSRVPQLFASASKCRECHPKVYDSWAATSHAKAFETLKKTKQQADPECVNCHTTGFNSLGGFVSEADTPQLTGVQCESCHGSGIIHVRRPAKGYGKTLQSTCTRCHDAAMSPKFDYEEYKKRILHSNSQDK